MGGCRDLGCRGVAAVLAVAMFVSAASPAVAGKFNAVLKVGQKAPEWTGLLGVDGKRHSLADLKAARGVLLVFLSNRCPMTRQRSPAVGERAWRL